jgi:hypothetical protein
MHRTRGTILSFVIVAAVVVAAAPSAHAAVPGWAKSAVKWAANHDYLKVSDVKPNAPMPRARFARIVNAEFGAGTYTRKDGSITAAEVDKALVKALGGAEIAQYLDGVRAADGWDPGISRHDGYEIIAREMGLRYNRDTNEGEHFEADADELLRQADTLYAIHQAATDPSTWGVDPLMNFELPTMSDEKKKIVKFAFNQVGSPYVYGGEWKKDTAAGYPYGAQPGGFDCTGLVWYVLQKATSSYNPPGRDYTGWSLPDRSSIGIAQGTTNRLAFSELKVGDVLVFTYGGVKKASQAYHGAVYIGSGWMIHSSGSRDGVSIAYVGKGSYWRGEFAWGRRVIR